METTHSKRTNEQIALWNGTAGRAWVEAQESLDRLFEPFEDLLVEAVAARRAQRVLDVGCGTGSTTLAVARRLGAQRRCRRRRHLGADDRARASSAPSARARRRASSAPTRRRHAFEPASFDMIISRFGVMFFDDSVRAFANLRRAASARRRAATSSRGAAPRRIRS